MSCLICLNFLTTGKSGMRTQAELAPLQAVRPLMLPSSLMCNRERMILDSVSVLNFGIGLVLGFSSFPGYQTRNRSFARPSILDSASLSTSVLLQVTDLGFRTFSLFAKSQCCASKIGRYNNFHSPFQPDLSFENKGLLDREQKFRTRICCACS